MFCYYQSWVHWLGSVELTIWVNKSVILMLKKRSLFRVYCTLAKLTKNSKFNLTSVQHFCVHLLSMDQDARHFSEEKFSCIGCVHRRRGSVCSVSCMLTKLIKNVEPSLTFVLPFVFYAFTCKNFLGPWTCLKCMVFIPIT